MAVTATLRRTSTRATTEAPAIQDQAKPLAPVTDDAKAKFAASLARSRPAPAIIEAEIVETPVEGVQVETVNTYAPPPEGEEADAAYDHREANPPAAGALAVRNIGAYHNASDGGLEGDFDSEDIKLPQLKIVNGSGALSRLYNQGTLLYADEVLWTTPDPKPGSINPTMRFVPVKLTKQWRENLTQAEMDDGEMSRNVSTRQEAERLGGATRWINDEKPRWEPSARCIFLLEEPEGSSHPAFNTVLDGKNYAPCVYYASGGGYRASAKQMFNAAQIALKDKATGKIIMFKKFWTWQVGKSSGGKYVVFVPVVRLLREETGPELRELALTIGGARDAIAASDE